MSLGEELNLELVSFWIVFFFLIKIGEFAIHAPFRKIISLFACSYTRVVKDIAKDMKVVSIGFMLCLHN